MKSTDGQICVDGPAQGQSVGATVVGCRAILPSSVEAPNTERKQTPSCNMGEEDNSGPAIAWLPEKIGQSARHTNVDHPENKVRNDLRRDVSIIHESFDASFTHSSG